MTVNPDRAWPARSSSAPRLCLRCRPAPPKRRDVGWLLYFGSRWRTASRPIRRHLLPRSQTGAPATRSPSGKDVARGREAGRRRGPTAGADRRGGVTVAQRGQAPLGGGQHGPTQDARPPFLLDERDTRSELTRLGQPGEAGGGGVRAPLVSRASVLRSTPGRDRDRRVGNGKGGHWLLTGGGY